VKKLFKKLTVLFLMCVVLFALSVVVEAGHNYHATYNPTTCGECHNVSHAGNQDAKTIFPGYPWLFIGEDEYDIQADWKDYTSFTILSTPTLDPVSRVCLKCHGKSSYKDSSRMSYIYIDPDGHYGHPIGVEITDSLISQRATRTPVVLQDEMVTLAEMREIFYLGGPDPDRNIINCATCHGYIHRGDKGPYGKFLTLPYEDSFTGFGGEICGACHSGKWLSLTEQS
jgi:hypothetical protein